MYIVEYMDWPPLSCYSGCIISCHLVENIKTIFGRIIELYCFWNYLWSVTNCNVLMKSTRHKNTYVLLSLVYSQWCRVCISQKFCLIERSLRMHNVNINRNIFHNSDYRANYACVFPFQAIYQINCIRKLSVVMLRPAFKNGSMSFITIYSGRNSFDGLCSSFPV